MALSVRPRRIAVGGLLVAMVAAAAPALAGPNKGYTVDVAGTALRGTPVTFTVTFNAPAKQELGSARLTAPDDYVITDVSVVAPAVPIVDGTVITLNGLEIPSGGSEQVRVTADVPCESSDITWDVAAKQANDFNGMGNDLQLAAGSQLESPLVGVCKPCPPGQACEATLDSGNKKLSVRGLAGATEGKVTLALGSGLQITCAGQRSVMTETALFNVTGDREKTASVLVPRREVPDGDEATLDLCFGSPDPDAVPGAVQQGFFDWNGDGFAEPVYVGLLPDCSDTVLTTCVSRRDRVARNDAIIEARLPAGDPAYRP